MDPCWTKSSKDQPKLVADMETGENKVEVELTPSLKALDVLSWSKTRSSTSPIPLKQLLIRFPDSVIDYAELMQDGEIIEVKAKNINGVFTALDVFQEGRIDTETKRSSWNILKQYHGLLVTATLLAAMTFHALLRSPAIFLQHQTPLQSDQISHLFVLFNSVAFFTSLALITLLTCHLPMKPWLFIVLVSTIGAYMCAITVVSPSEVATVIWAGNCVLIAALFKYIFGSRPRPASSNPSNFH